MGRWRHHAGGERGGMPRSPSFLVWAVIRGGEAPVCARGDSAFPGRRRHTDRLWRPHGFRRFSGTALVLHRHYIGTPRVLQRCYSGPSLVLQWYRTPCVLQLPWTCIAQAQSWYRAVTALAQYWLCTGTASEAAETEPQANCHMQIAAAGSVYSEFCPIPWPYPHVLEDC